MACAKPPEPGRATPPSNSVNFTLTQADERVAHALSMIERGDFGKGFDKEVVAIEKAIERLKVAGASEVQIKRLEGALSTIRGEGYAALKEEAESGKAHKTQGSKAVSNSKVVEALRDEVHEKSAARAREVLTTPGHWAHEAFKRELIRVVETAGKIPEVYKDTLARDAAMLLRVCPNAGGLVVAILTRGQPRGTFARRMQTEGNDAVGAAYEIMGTAALCAKGSKPVNTAHGAPELSIDPAKDRLVFGPKAFMNHKYAETKKVADRDRKSTEADAQIVKVDKDGSIREIGIDFKHVKESRTKGTSKDLRNQIEAVKEQIKSGVYDEFHFVSNGKFSDRFMKAVDAANDELLRLDRNETEEVVKDGTTSRKRATGDGMAKIAVHQYVSSIINDPLTDGETS